LAESQIPERPNEYSGILWIELYENQTVVVNLPDGYFVSHVYFASYGTPISNGGNYELGDCHAETSMSVVESILLGSHNFPIRATNDVFGDPCPGTYKRLYVAAYLSNFTVDTTIPETTIAPTTTTTIFETTTVPITTTTIQSTTTTTTTTTSTTAPPVTTSSPQSTIPENFIVEQRVQVAEIDQLVTSSAFVHSMTVEQAREIFASLDMTAMNAAEVQQMIEAIQTAPEEIRLQFEESIKEINESIGSYIPVDSKISLAARQIIIAASALIAIAGTISIDTQSTRGRGR
jgi:hypothetical protein